MALMLVRVTSTNFCAGLVLENDWVVRAAPILRRFVGWHRAHLASFLRRQGYQVEVVW